MATDFFIMEVLLGVSVVTLLVGVVLFLIIRHSDNKLKRSMPNYDSPPPPPEKQQPSTSIAPPMIIQDDEDGVVFKGFNRRGTDNESNSSTDNN
jgi:hypothetical protein